MLFIASSRFRYVLHRPPASDNFIFSLCYRWTVLLLVVFSFIVTCRLFVGYSFTCYGRYDELPSNYLGPTCYSEEMLHITQDHISMTAISSRTPSNVTVKYKRYQTYYPWVNLFFLIQAFCFYLPHLLWKSYEGGYIQRLGAGVEKFFEKEEKRGLELCYLAKYVLVTQGKHKLYTSLYIFFEACNYAIALAQTLWLVSFFAVTGVPEFLPIEISTWSDFRHFYFPPTAQCISEVTGASGNKMRMSALCVLPLNHLYMKMFLFLHTWYIFVTVLCGIVLIYRIALLAPSFRVFVIKFLSPLAEKSILKSLCYRLTYSDWFFLTRLQKAMTDVDFAQMVDKIAIVSQVKSIDAQKDDDHRSSFFEEALKEQDISATSAL